MESSSGVARKTHNLQRRNGSRNESSRYTKRPLNEGRWKVARHEAKREIRMVGRPAGTERLPNVIEIYLAVISLFLPLGRPPRPDVSRSPYIKERGRRIDRNGRCLVMQTRICPSIRCFDLEFVPRMSVLRTSLRGEREEGGGTEGDRPSGLIHASVHVPSVDRCFNRRKKRIKKRRYVNHWRREGGGMVVAACYCYIGKYCWERDDGFDGDFFDLSSIDLQWIYTNVVFSFSGYVIYRY